MTPVIHHLHFIVSLFCCPSLPFHTVTTQDKEIPINMSPFAVVEMVILAVASLLGVEARKPFTAPTNVDYNDQLDRRDARHPFMLPVDFEINRHRKPFTAPPAITGRPVIENGIAVERPVIQESVVQHREYLPYTDDL